MCLSGACDGNYGENIIAFLFGMFVIPLVFVIIFSFLIYKRFFRPSNIAASRALFYFCLLPLVVMFCLNIGYADTYVGFNFYFLGDF